MIDFKLSLTDSDLVFDNNALTLATDETYIAAQRLKLALDINLGEWFANIDFGVPYIKTEESEITSAQRYFFGDSKVDLSAFIKITLDDFIEERDYISSLESSEYTFDPSSREWVYSYTVTTSEGSTFTDSTVTA